MNPPEPPIPAKQKLLDAALTAFLSNGFAAARVEDIAKAAGISKGAVYLHYPTKEALFRGVVDAGVISPLVLAEDVVADSRGSAADLLAEVLHTNLIEFWESPSSAVIKLVVAESQQFPGLAEEFYSAVTARACELIQTVLQRGVDQGEFVLADVPYTARLIINALDHEVVLAHSVNNETRGSFDPHRYIDALLQLVTGTEVKEQVA